MILDWNGGRGARGGGSLLEATASAFATGAAIGAPVTLGGRVSGTAGGGAGMGMGVLTQRPQLRESLRRLTH